MNRRVLALPALALALGAYATPAERTSRAPDEAISPSRTKPTFTDRRKAEKAKRKGRR